MGNVFFAGGKIGMTEPQVSNLPRGYTELAYIQSSGTQYIDTGFKPNNNTRIVLEYDSLTTGTEFIFGARHNSSANSTSYSFSFVHLADSWVRSDFGSVETGITSISPTKILVDKNKNKTTYNSGSVTATAQTFQNNYNLTLCAVNTAGTVSAHAKIKLYHCQIYDNGTLIRDFVPCVSDADGVGLYDLVEDKFYGNSGTGAFLGSEVA